MTCDPSVLGEASAGVISPLPLLPIKHRKGQRKAWHVLQSAGLGKSRFVLTCLHALLVTWHKQGLMSELATAYVHDYSQGIQFVSVGICVYVTVPRTTFITHVQ